MPRPALRSPQRVQLGMVRMNERAYIDLAAGTVTGEAKAATNDLAIPIVTSPTPLAVTKKVKGVLSSATSVATKAQTSAEKAAAAARAAAAAQAADAKKGGGRDSRRHAERPVPRRRRG